MSYEIWKAKWIALSLPKLTPEEEIICKIDMSVKVFIKKYGMTGIVGSIVHFPKEMLAEKLPRQLDSLPIYVLCKKKDPRYTFESGSGFKRMTNFSKRTQSFLWK